MLGSLNLIRKFYGRSKGKKLSLGKKDALETCPNEYKIIVTHNDILDLCTLFGRSYNMYELEIGFGAGEHLLNRAKLYPNTGFIGVEPFLNGYAAALRDALDSHITNIRFYNDDAHFLLSVLPDNILNIIHLNYPDPWHKKRHWKRRFVSHDTLDEFARLLIQGGEFRCVTDIDSYAAWVLMHIKQRNDFIWNVKNSSHFIDPFEHWVTTRYEQKALREGRNNCYLRFIK